MKLLPIIERLKPVSGIRTVEGAKALAELATIQVALPGLFVVPAAEDFRPVQEGAGLIQLEETIQFDVVVIINASATRGRDEDELEGFSEAVKTLLFGWAPSAEFRPIVPVASRLLGVGSGRVSWIIRFRTVQHLRKIA
ncbi:phage tail terminator protein [Polymorphobacter sp.]|uniref:phage tail terminator protein n=1 Tax=Polymorphobacter sp. TaxID=1909290 RepID=UPI003F6FF449